MSSEQLQRYTSPFIRSLVEQGFSLFNVGLNKKPVNKDGYGWDGWETKTYAELCANHTPTSTRWGMHVGKQENGRYIMSLDFDIYDENSKDDEVDKLWKRYSENCKNENGLYSSSTEGNMNVLVDYTNSPTIKALIEKHCPTGCKFTVGKMEIILKRNQIIPPTQTPCKRTKKTQLGNPRTFKNPDEPFYVIEDDENDFTVQFIMELFDKKYGKKATSSTLKRKQGEAKTAKPASIKKTKTARVQTPKPKPETDGDENEADSSDIEECDEVQEEEAAAAPKKRKIIKAARKQAESSDDEEDNEEKDDEDYGQDGEDMEKAKYLELLFKVIKNERGRNNSKIVSWDQWFQICGILKTHGYDKSVFIRYSELFEQTNEASKLWDAANVENTPMSIYGLQSIAKEINPHGYKLWLIKNNTALHFGILDKGENDVARFISEAMKLKLAYCNNEWWHCDDSNLWNRVTKPIAPLVSFIQTKINEALECTLCELGSCTDDEKRQELARRKQKYEYHYQNVCKSGYSNQIVEFSKHYLCDNKFTEKLDIGLYQMVYQNGILDLKTMEFREGIRPTDYMSKTISFNYELPTDEDVKFVRRNLKKICNNDDKHLDYYLSAIGYALTGDSTKQQNFWYIRGQKADNGKSVIFEALDQIISNYVTKANKDVLDKGADLRKEIATWQGRKLLWLNEVSKKEKDAELVKAVCDGTGYKYNRLYSTEAIVMPVNFKLFAVSNHTLSIDGDAGVARRFKLLQFGSKFGENYTEDNFEKLEFVKDLTFGEKLQNEYKHALLHLIYLYSQKYWEEKRLKPYPSEWDTDAAEVMADNNRFQSWFDETFEKKAGAKTNKRDFNIELGKSGLKNVIIKDELVRLNLPKYDSQLVVKGVKGWFHGFQKIITPPPVPGNNDENKDEVEDEIEDEVQ